MLDVKPVSELKATMPQVLKQLQSGHKPLLIVSNGQPQAVLQDVASNQQTQDALVMLKMMVHSERSVTEGRGSSTKQVLLRLRQRVANQA